MKAACSSQASWSRICREESQPGPWASRTAKLAMAGAYRPLPTPDLPDAGMTGRCTAGRRTGMMGVLAARSPTGVAGQGRGIAEMQAMQLAAGRAGGAVPGRRGAAAILAACAAAVLLAGCGVAGPAVSGPTRQQLHQD